MVKVIGPADLRENSTVEAPLLRQLRLEEKLELLEGALVRTGGSAYGYEPTNFIGDSNQPFYINTGM